MCLAMCLKFPKFEAGCAYELYAYKKKRVPYFSIFLINIFEIKIRSRLFLIIIVSDLRNFDCLGGDSHSLSQIKSIERKVLREIKAKK